MEPWYKVATPRKEVREGRSFNPDEFAIALEQVVAGTAPEDYRDPAQFFARTCFTRALREHAGMVLRRLSGQDREHRAGAHAHHPVRRRQDAHAHHAVPPGEERRRRGRVTTGSPTCCAKRASLPCPRRRSPCSWATPGTRRPGRETPWIDIARQLAGDKGVEALGPAAQDHAARHRGHRAGLPGGGRAGAPALRRGAQLPEPPPRRAPNRSTPSSRT